MHVPVNIELNVKGLKLDDKVIDDLKYVGKKTTKATKDGAKKLLASVYDSVMAVLPALLNSFREGVELEHYDVRVA